MACVKHHSKFKYAYKAITILVDLTVFCLNNVTLQYKEKFYRQTNGIITGGKPFNVMGYYCYAFCFVTYIGNFKKGFHFQSFIDDIVWIANNRNSHLIIKDLKVEFAKHDLKLVFKQIDASEPDRQLEFLDVLHVTDQTAKRGFVTKNFTKKTAQN